MADQLYLSLWFPNFRLAALPGSLVSVMRQFALIAQSDEKNPKPDSTLGRVAAASTFPIDWTESPVYQRIFVLDDRAENSADTEGSIIENAVTEATEQLHEDSAYEFEMVWNLWQAQPVPTQNDADEDDEPIATLAWKLQPARVRIVGFGPDFDTGSYEQNGHIRIDFGLDTPWVLDDEILETNPHSNPKLASFAHRQITEKIKQNIEKLLAFTLSVEKNCAISSRLLWTESGEPLAEKLIAKLQRLN
jgi:hypothetical protein